MEKYKKVTYILASILLGCLVIYLFMKFAIGVILPFIIAFLVVALSRPAIKMLQSKTRLPVSLIAIIVVLFFCILLLLLASLLVSVVAKEIGNIINDLISNLSQEKNFITMIFDFITEIEGKLPFLKSLTGNDQGIMQMVQEVVTDGIKGLSVSLTTFITGIIKNMPEIALSTIVLTLSIFYFAKDYEKISRWLEGLIPKKLHRVSLIFKNDTINAIKRYIYAYLLLLLITFTILFSSFLILGIENSFVLALLISVVDMLPILGASAITLPWAIIMLIYGDLRLGIGLLIISIIVYVVRQYAEPKLLSTQTNIHPLITLFALYAGLKLFGISGLLLAPIFLCLIKPLYDLYKNINEKR